MSVDCFKKAGLPHLQDQVESLTKNGMPEKDAISTVANKHFNETIKELSDELNKIRRAAKLPVEETPQFDPSTAIQAIEEKYQVPPAEPPKPPTQAPSGGQGMPKMGTRETVAKLQEESKLEQRLKDALDDYSQYEVKKQAVTQKRARQTIDRLGEDEALAQATSWQITRSQEEKIALLSELADLFSTQFRQATQRGDTKASDAAYGKFMIAMDALSNRITDVAQALSYMNLVNRMFETKVGAVRFATRQIEQSRAKALENHAELKLTIEKVLEEFDKLPHDDFIRSKRVQELIRNMAGQTKTRKVVAKQKQSAAAAKLKEAWQNLNKQGIIWDPESKARDQYNLTTALIDYIKSTIEVIISESGEFIQNIHSKVSDEVGKFVKENGIQAKKEDLETLITPAVQEFQRSGRYTPPITKFEREDAAKKITQALLPKDEKTGKRMPPTKPEIQKFYETMVRRILVAEPDRNQKQKQPDQIIEDVINNLDKYADVLMDVKNELEANGVDTSDIQSVFDLPFFQKKLSSELRPELKELVKTHFQDVNRTKEKLTQRLIDEYGLKDEPARQFSNAINKLFDDYATKEKMRLIEKYTPKTNTSKKTAVQRKELYDKVIELSNIGALSDRQLDNAIAQAFGLPAMTPEISAKVEEMVDAINKTPDRSRFRNIAITKLTDYIAQQQKFNWTDYMLSSYKAGIFSGIDTQALNLQGNMFNVLELGFMLGFTNPAKAARFYRAFSRPESLSRSMNEALEILKTGYDPRSTGDSRRALERTPRSFFGLGKPLKGAKQMFDPSLEQQKKYVFRALSAGDLLFSTAINDALQNELLMREAYKQGLRGKEADRYVREQMGYTPENIKQKAQVAEQEAKSGAIPNDRTSITLRTYELIEQQRNPDVVKAARQYASQQIMTNTPNGFIGIFARNVNRLIHEIPVLSAFIPVVNFAANAMSRAVQYMPHTALARAIAHSVRDRTAGIHFSTQMKNLVESYKTGDFDTEMRLRRALIGTVTMAVLIALLGDDDNDENILSKLLGKKIKIHGSGPGTQFNRQKTYQLQESGWLPYSIQVGDKYIPFKNYPALNVLLASMGEWNDAVRYKKLSRKDAGERFIFAMGNSFKVISEMGFLTSLNTLLSAALEGEVKNFVDVPSRIATGELVPKFQRNLVNLFDNKIYASGDIQEMTTRSLPVVNTFANEPMVNALGEPIEKNWWDRVQLWNTDTYSKHKPIWSANADKKYFFSTPNRYNLEDKIGHRLTTEEYNQYFKYRGEEIVKNWTPEIAKLSPEKYAQKMDRLTRYADYKALVRMGAMKSDVMKDINFMLDDVLQIQRDMREIKKEIFE